MARAESYKRLNKRNMRKEKATKISVAFCFLLINAHLLLISALALELHNSVFEGKQGVVAADSDVVTGMDFRSALAHDDAPRKYVLTVLTLYAEALCVTVSTVVGGTRTFFMSE